MSQEVTFFYKDFILVCDDLYTQEDCDYLINYFEAQKEGGFTGSSVSAVRQDEQLAVPDPAALLKTPFNSLYTDKFWDIAYPEYLNYNPVLKNIASHGLHWLKIQKTPTKGGFHNFHGELADRHSQSRLLVVMTYLNDVTDGGETEFLNQAFKVEPKVGRTVIWPAYFTHTHRGNPPYSNEKYIITGWVEFN